MHTDTDEVDSRCLLDQDGFVLVLDASGKKLKRVVQVFRNYTGEINEEEY